MQYLTWKNPSMVPGNQLGVRKFMGNTGLLYRRRRGRRSAMKRCSKHQSRKENFLITWTNQHPDRKLQGNTLIVNYV